MVYLARANPLRTCLGCGKRASQGELLRVYVAESGLVDADVDNRSSGRGGYLCLRVECLWEAKKKNRFLRSMRASAGSAHDATLSPRIAGRLADRMLRRLHTARRAQAVVPFPGTQEPGAEEVKLLVVGEGSAAPLVYLAPAVSAGSREALALALQAPGAQAALVLDDALASELMTLAAARTDFLRTPPPKANQARQGQGKTASMGPRPINVGGAGQKPPAKALGATTF